MVSLTHWLRGMSWVKCHNQFPFPTVANKGWPGDNRLAHSRQDGNRLHQSLPRTAPLGDLRLIGHAAEPWQAALTQECSLVTTCRPHDLQDRAEAEGVSQMLGWNSPGAHTKSERAEQAGCTLSSQPPSLSRPAEESSVALQQLLPADGL